MDVCLHLIQANVKVSQSHSSTSQPQWKKPTPGYLKSNTDGAFDVNVLTGATSAVLRNEDVTFLKVVSRCLPYVASELVAEADSWRDGLRLIDPSVHHHVILESYSMEVLKLWKTWDEQRSEITPILKEIQGLIEGLASFTTMHTRHLGNVAVHLCARQASSSHAVVSECNLPNFLIQQLHDDFNHTD
jgi:ribonuclease HI